MEKNVTSLQRYMAMVVTIYVVGFAVTYFFYQAQGVADGVLLIDGGSFSQAASWPMKLLQLLL